MSIAQAVAASSAFPQIIQPLLVKFTTEKGEHITVPLSDGGVYDNLALDPVMNSPPIHMIEEMTKFKHHRIVFVSNAVCSDENEMCYL